MDNRKGRIEEQKDTFNSFTRKDAGVKVVKRKKNRREKDTINKITRECIKDWRGVDFDEGEI